MEQFLEISILSIYSIQYELFMGQLYETLPTQLFVASNCSVFGKIFDFDFVSLNKGNQLN